MSPILTRFPPGFHWGAATSAHQVEGGNRWNDWWRFEHEPGAIRDGSVSGDACRHWERFDQDFDRARAYGHTMHRLSLEWSRIEPAPGRRDAAAVAHYHEVLASLRRHGLIVGCISNSDGTVAELLASAGLGASLEFVVDSGVVGVEKPDPAIFRIALERAAVAPGEAMHVGDLYPVDVVGARRAGIEPVLLDPLGRYGDRGCRTAPDVPAFCRALVSSLGRA